jgi:hypothetical protein
MTQITSARENEAIRITTRPDEIPGTNSRTGMKDWRIRNHSSQVQETRFEADRRAVAAGLGRIPGADGGDNIAGSVLVDSARWSASGAICTLLD